MYKTTKEDLEQAVARVSATPEIVAGVVNRVLDKFLIEAIEERTSSGKPSKIPVSVYLVTPSMNKDNYSRYVFVTDKELSAVMAYEDGLLYLSDDPFSDYVTDVTKNIMLGATCNINIYPKRA